MPNTIKTTPKSDRLAKLLLRFPAEARGVLSALIALYHSGGVMQWRLPVEKSRPTLDKIRRAADDLATEIERVGVREFTNIFLVAGIPEGEARILSTLVAVRQLSNCLVIAHRRLGPRRGPKTEVKRQFVAAVAEFIVLYTGKRSAVSYKAGSLAEMVREIIEIVDPNIGPGTITEALKKHARWQRIGEIKR